MQAPRADWADRAETIVFFEPYHSPHPHFGGRLAQEVPLRFQKNLFFHHINVSHPCLPLLIASQLRKHRDLVSGDFIYEVGNLPDHCHRCVVAGSRRPLCIRALMLHVAPRRSSSRRAPAGVVPKILSKFGPLSAVSAPISAPNYSIYRVTLIYKIRQ